jgi:hypothetical protein
MKVLLLSVAMPYGYTNGVAICCLQGFEKYTMGRRNILSFETTFLDRQSLQFQLCWVPPTVYRASNNSIFFGGGGGGEEFSTIVLLK